MTKRKPRDERRETRATLELTTPVRDATGRERRRFAEGEALWQPQAMPIQIGEAPSASSLLLPGAPPAAKPQTMMVPGFAILHAVSPTEAVRLWVPLSQVAAIRTPLVEAAVRQKDGTVERQLVPAAAAAQAVASVVRAEAVEAAS